ncbi:hypothetical protein G6W42_10025 [Campylobacter concisus]|uniref:hypothetical protein n=1 Tax=Campylobacter concisus TaxID=199 RepID=UPI0018833A12|nr:hypothetical protein [Campylobacter concisus]MBE9852937.1 hypothetical protein [Campylobacter concisus]
MNYGLLAVASSRSKEAPFPLNNPLTPTTLEVHAMVLAHCMQFMTKKLKQILKFISEHITALNLVLNEVQPKFSSLLRRVSKILKFANLLLSTYKCQTNFKISLASNFGSKI